MTDDLFRRLAEEAGFVEYELDDGTTRAFDVRYARFAALVAAECRAAVRDVHAGAHAASQAKDASTYLAGYQDSATDCDEAIREKFGEPK